MQLAPLCPFGRPLICICSRFILMPVSNGSMAQTSQDEHINSGHWNSPFDQLMLPDLVSEYPVVTRETSHQSQPLWTFKLLHHRSCDCSSASHLTSHSVVNIKNQVKTCFSKTFRLQHRSPQASKSEVFRHTHTMAASTDWKSAMAMSRFWRWPGQVELGSTADIDNLALIASIVGSSWHFLEVPAGLTASSMLTSACS